MSNLKISQLTELQSAPQSTDVLPIVNGGTTKKITVANLISGSGTNGTSGTSGTSGARGSDGVNGTNGTSGTSGVAGTNGTSGTSGTGVAGTNGTSGTSGVAGTNGTSGISGTHGTSGTSGIATNGTHGTSGTSGIATNGTNGTSGTSGSSGVSGDIFRTTSTTSYTIPAVTGGTQTFSVPTGLAYTQLQDVIISLDTNINTHIHGEVQSYGGTSLNVKVTDFSNPGSSGASWIINLDGAAGGNGANGTNGTSGTSGVAGANGTNGTSGTSGAAGANGTNGTSGTSGIATNGTHGTSGTSGVATNGTHGTSGTSGVAGANGTNGTSGTSGVAGTNGTSGAAGANGTHGTSGTSGAAGANGTHGTSGTSGTSASGGVTGAPQIYQFAISYGSQVNDQIDSPISYTAIGPNGEDAAALTTAGWSISRDDTNKITITRPSAKRVQPLVNVMTHGKAGSIVYSKSPSALSTTGNSAIQNISGGAFTSLTMAGLTGANTGVGSSGATTLYITFGLLS